MLWHLFAWAGLGASPFLIKAQACFDKLICYYVL